MKVVSWFVILCLMWLRLRMLILWFDILCCRGYFGFLVYLFVCIYVLVVDMWWFFEISMVMVRLVMLLFSILGVFVIWMLCVLVFVMLIVL